MGWVVIANPHAGSFPGEEALAGLRMGGHPVELRLTERAGHGEELAAEAVRAGVYGVLACGGDGTVGEVVRGLLGSDVPMGLLPAGTGNDFARTLGLPLTPVEAALALQTCRPVPIDLLVVRTDDGETHVGLNAAVGGDPADATGQLDQQTKRALGPLAFVLGTMEAVGAPNEHDVTIVLSDGHRECGPAVGVVVANGRTVGGGVRVAPYADPADGLLEVSVVRVGQLADYATLAARSVVGEAIEDPLVEHWPARWVEVSAEPPMPFNLDGELIGTTPLRIELKPGALNVLCPPGRFDP